MPPGLRNLLRKDTAPGNLDADVPDDDNVPSIPSVKNGDRSKGIWSDEKRRALL
jgi:hypothetical protein